MLLNHNLSNNTKSSQLFAFSGAFWADKAFDLGWSDHVLSEKNICTLYTNSLLGMHDYQIQLNQPKG